MSETPETSNGKADRSRKISQLIIDVNNATAGLNGHPYDLRRKSSKIASKEAGDRRSSCDHVSRPARPTNHSPNLNQTQRKKIRKLCNSCSTNHSEHKFDSGHHLFGNLKNGDDYISKLPDEVLLKIFSYLQGDELSRVSPVSKKFYSISNDCKLWKRLYKDLFEYDLPLFREGNANFVFKSVEEADMPNPWKASFKQLHKGSIHVREESDLNALRNLVLKMNSSFQNEVLKLGKPYEMLIGKPDPFASQLGNPLGYQLSRRSPDETEQQSDDELRAPLVFIHKGHYRPKSIVIDYDVVLIGAAPGPVDSIAKQVVIENSKESTMHFTNGVRNSYLGYVTLLFKPEENLCVDRSPQSPQPPNALRIDKMARPKVSHCQMRSTCEFGSTIYVTGEGTEPRISDCRITDCSNVGCFVESYAKGWYQGNYIARNALAGIWIKHADPVFKRNTVCNGKDVGIFVFDYGRGYFLENDIFGNRIAGFECKAGANPTVVKCSIHHGETGGIYVHESSKGQFLENKIYSNKFAGVWITSKSNPTIRSNEIFDGLQVGY